MRRAVVHAHPRPLPACFKRILPSSSVVKRHLKLAFGHGRAVWAVCFESDFFFFFIKKGKTYFEKSPALAWLQSSLPRLKLILVSIMITHRHSFGDLAGEASEPTVDMRQVTGNDKATGDQPQPTGSFLSPVQASPGLAGPTRPTELPVPTPGADGGAERWAEAQPSEGVQSHEERAGCVSQATRLPPARASVDHVPWPACPAAPEARRSCPVYTSASSKA